NPWEISNDTRGEWAAALGIATLAEQPEVDVLYWVGCMGSFDARNRKVATAFVKIMQAANVKFGILGPEEMCNGDPARRIGQEYLWQVLAQQNIETLNGYGFNKGPGIHQNGKTAPEFGYPTASAPATADGHSGPDGTGQTNELRDGHLPGGRAYNIKTVVATCPHCFNTLANEYPELGGNYEVVHHTVFIQRLVESGQ